MTSLPLIIILTAIIITLCIVMYVQQRMAKLARLRAVEQTLINMRVELGQFNSQLDQWNESLLNEKENTNV